MSCQEPLWGEPLTLDIGPTPTTPLTLPEWVWGESTEVIVLDTGSAVPGATGDRDSCTLHGTAVASVVQQVAPGARIHAIRYTERPESPAGTAADASAALRQVLAHHALRSSADPALHTVLNMSVVSCEEDPTLSALIDAALSAGILVVASTGNSGQCPEGTPRFPADQLGVLGIGAVEPRPFLPDLAEDHEGADTDTSIPAPPGSAAAADAGRQPAGYSAGLLSADLYAPGGPVSATLDTPEGPRTIVGSPQPFVGTSMAVPVVAGAAALLWDILPDASTAEMATLLRATSQPGGVPAARADMPGDAGEVEGIRVLDIDRAVTVAMHARQATAPDGRAAVARALEIADDGMAPSTEVVIPVSQVEGMPPHSVPPPLTVWMVAATIVALVLIVTLIYRAVRPGTGADQGTPGMRGTAGTAGIGGKGGGAGAAGGAGSAGGAGMAGAGGGAGSATGGAAGGAGR